MNSMKGKAKQIFKGLLGDGAQPPLSPTQAEGLVPEMGALQREGGSAGQEGAALVLGAPGEHSRVCEIN